MEYLLSPFSEKIFKLKLFISFAKSFSSMILGSHPIIKNWRINIDLNKSIESVDWIPGGIFIIRKAHIIKDQYYPFEGKAYCEDLFHSKLLKNKGIKLFISNKSFYKSNVKIYKDLKTNDFIQFIKNDFKARNYYRKAIKNPLIPFIVTYSFLIINYFLRKIISGLNS